MRRARYPHINTASHCVPCVKSASRQTVKAKEAHIVQFKTSWTFFSKDSLD